MTADLVAQIARAVEPGAHIVWDFDGVIADTEPLHGATYAAMAEARGMPLEPDFFLAQVGKTEPAIWADLVRDGFPAGAASVAALTAERLALFRARAGSELRPSGLAGSLMPLAARRGARQHVVSNGDPDLIDELLAAWALDGLASLRRRRPGADKRALVAQLCRTSPRRPLVIEDNDSWLAFARECGALTVSVRHALNARQSLDADFRVDLDGRLAGSIP
ncbi:MAG: hypothetical protein QM611_12105 [Microbacterium sp.]|uniref:HAD family hydrolase n=1 Tax=Microbacterium sp. TaxID=51671 RepID=UPI0039E59C19